MLRSQQLSGWVREYVFICTHTLTHNIYKYMYLSINIYIYTQEKKPCCGPKHVATWTMTKKVIAHIVVVTVIVGWITFQSRLNFYQPGRLTRDEMYVTRISSIKMMMMMAAVFGREANGSRRKKKNHIYPPDPGQKNT